MFAGSALQNSPTAPATDLEIGPFEPTADRLVVAKLIYDSWEGRSHLGLRGGAGESRQLAFRTHLVDIALTLMEAPLRMFSLTGQIFPVKPDFDGFDVELVGDHDMATDVRKSTHTDDLGEFWLDQLPAGGYHMVVRCATLGILVTPLSLNREAV